MKKILYLITALLIMGCETNPVEPSGPTLKERVKQALPSVKIIEAGNAAWCQTAQTCTYLGEVYCDSESDKAAKKCDKKIRSRIVKRGGDTFVQQEAGKVHGGENFYDDGYYRIFGQAYKCNNRNSKLGEDFAKAKHPKALSQIKVVSKTYATQCNTTNGCKINNRVRTCASVQDRPFKRCREKFQREHDRLGSINQIVLKQDLVNRAGFYRMFLDSYKCP